MSLGIIIFVVLLLVGLISYRYKNGEFIQWRPVKPNLVFFPKYEVELEISEVDVGAKLEAVGFKKVSGTENKWERGSSLGDFSINKILLRAEIPQSKNVLRIYSPNFIFFDTGDIWRFINEHFQQKSLNKAI